MLNLWPACQDRFKGKNEKFPRESLESSSQLTKNSIQSLQNYDLGLRKNVRI